MFLTFFCVLYHFIDQSHSRNFVFIPTSVSTFIGVSFIWTLPLPATHLSKITLFRLLHDPYARFTLLVSVARYRCSWSSELPRHFCRVGSDWSGALGGTRTRVLGLRGRYTDLYMTRANYWSAFSYPFIRHPYLSPIRSISGVQVPSDESSGGIRCKGTESNC